MHSLRRVTSCLPTDSGISNKPYVLARRKGLNSFQCKVSLVFDEIYVSQRLEYSNDVTVYSIQ